MAEAPEFFEGVGPVRYAGPESDDPMSFRWYDADRVVAGRRMEDHLRLAVCYWHSFVWPGSDIFGAGTLDRPWNEAGLDPMDAARAQDVRRLRVLRQARRAVLLLPRPRHRT